MQEIQNPVSESREGATSPLLNSESEKSDLGESIYLLRLTPYGKYGISNVLALLNSISEVWVMGVEEHPQEHYHIVLKNCYDEGIRPDIKKWVRHWYTPEQITRGFGNKQYNLKEVKELEDEPKAIRYILKETRHIHSYGYQQEYLDKLKKSSFPKPKISNVKLGLQELEKRFLANIDMTEEDYITNFELIKAVNNQRVNKTESEGYARSATIRRNLKIIQDAME